MAFLCLDLAIHHRDLTTGQGITRQAFDLFALEHIVINGRLLAVGGNGFFLFRIPDHQIGIRSNQNRTLFRVTIQDLGDVGRGHGDKFVHRDPPCCNPVGPQHRHPVLKPAGAIGDLGKVTHARAFLLGCKGAVISRNHRKRATLQTRPQAVLVLFVAERWRHHAPRSMVPILVEILRFVQRQVLDQRLAPNAFALHTGATDGFVAFLTRRMHHIERRPSHIGNHDGTVCCLALDLRRAGIGVGLGSGVAFGQQLRGQFGHHIAIFGMHQRGCPQFGAAFEGRIQFVIIHHQRALVGKEMLEGVDAAPDDFFHVVKHLLAPPCHGHVEGIITVGAGRFIVPAFQRIQQAFARVGQGKIHHHRGAASQTGAGA